MSCFFERITQPAKREKKQLIEGQKIASDSDNEFVNSGEVMFDLRFANCAKSRKAQNNFFIIRGFQSLLLVRKRAEGFSSVASF